MGRTLPTVRQRLRSFRSEWGNFRKGLRGDIQTHYDTLMEFAAQHVDAAGNQNPTDLFPAISLSIDLEQQQEIAELKQRVAEVEEQLSEQDQVSDGGTPDLGEESR